MPTDDEEGDEDGENSKDNNSNLLIGVVDDRQQTSEMSVQKRELNDAQIGIIIGALGALVVLLAVIIVLIVVKRRRSKEDKKRHSFFQTSRLPLHCNEEKLCSTGSRYSPVGTSDSDDTKCSQQLPQLVYCEPRDSLRQDGALNRQRATSLTGIALVYIIIYFVSYITIMYIIIYLTYYNYVVTLNYNSFYKFNILQLL